MKLDQYSSAILSRLLTEFPQLISHVEECGYGDKKSFLIKYPNPHGGPTLDLTTCGEEITVGFGQWHTHINMADELTPEEEIAEAIAMVRDILTGRKKVYYAVRGGKLGASSLLKTDKEVGDFQASCDCSQLKISSWKAP